MRSHSFNNWVCGPDGLFAGTHFGGFFFLIFWAAVFCSLYLLIRKLTANRKEGRSTSNNSYSALSILEQRYASGEIGQDEFLQKKKDLLQ